MGFSLEIPADWLSGVYIGKLSTLPAPGGQYLDLEMSSEAYFIFVVRDDRKADLLFQASDMTWLSYNRWPQWRSMYDLGTAPWGASNGKVGYDVGFDRPYALFWNGFPAGLPPADQRVRRVSDDRVSAGLLAGEGRLRRHLHLQRRHPRGREGAASRRKRSCRSATTSTGPSRCSTTSPRRGMPASASPSCRAIRFQAWWNCCPSSDGRPNRVMRRAGRGFQGEQELMGSTSYGVGFTDWTATSPNTGCSRART